MGDNDFLVPFPVFTLVKGDTGTQGEFGADVIPEFGAPELGRFLPVFTDSDLADRFLASADLSELAVGEIDTAESFAVLLLALAREGVRHVGFDVESVARPRGRYKAIEFVLQALTKDW